LTLTNEFSKLRGKEYKLEKLLINYIELYKKAKIDTTIPYREKILNFSTLQYFEEYIYSVDEKVAITIEENINRQEAEIVKKPRRKNINLLDEMDWDR
jgi:hypothetical protein